MTYRQLYALGVETLAGAGIAEAELDARLLLEYICHTDRNALLVYGDSVRSSLEEQFYREALARRAARIPLQHITGEQEFMGLSFRVNEHTLIPRQDTEILVEEAMRYLEDGMRILDLCTGSGCILLSLLHYSNRCEGIGIDISPEALAVARENAARLGLEAVFLEGDLFAPLAECAKTDKNKGLFDMIISNPPYIETAVIDTLMPEVREHEPLLALDGKEDGLFFYRAIAGQAAAYMRAGAWIFLEIGYHQSAAVEALLAENGFSDIRTVQDYAGLDRVALARKGG
ncbi:MAG: peptide chain release factor N(5)-glutamine methyltransferase [Roseburia sp.]|nr:peptide chain release factor N(5)-glutamine methyltransferase [Roseburia sp.]